MDRDYHGTIEIEVPLTTRHFANIAYGLNERAQVTTGQASLEYNKKNVLNGNYKCKSELRAGYEKDVYDIALENTMKPIGIHYIHVQEMSMAQDSDYDMKHVELFELRNSKKLNLTGEFHVRTTETGQDYKIIAVHPNRTVILTSDYDYQNSTTKQKSKLQLDSNVWIGYDFKIQNLTNLVNESQIFSLELSYPKRNLSADGWYAVTENSFDSDLSLNWVNNIKDEYNVSIFVCSVDYLLVLKWYLLQDSFHTILVLQPHK